MNIEHENIQASLRKALEGSTGPDGANLRDHCSNLADKVHTRCLQGMEAKRSGPGRS